MSRTNWFRVLLSICLLAVVAIAASCSLALGDLAPATATATRTPRRPTEASATPLASTLAASLTIPTATSAPTVAPLAPPTDAPTAPPTSLPGPTAAPATNTTAPTQTKAPIATKAPPTPAPVPAQSATQPPPPPTARPTNPPAPSVEFKITELRVLGLGENNGGIEGMGAGRTIFITVLDAAGNPLSGAKIVNTSPYPGQAVTGDYPAPGGKGPGKAELLMDREEFTLKVESVNGAPVTSETSHRMSLIRPEPADIAGKLGDACPTVNNCPLPPGKHFSYVITFRRTR